MCNNIITLSGYKINTKTAFNSQKLVPTISKLLAMNRLAHSHKTFCTLNDHRVRDDRKLLLLPFIDVLISFLWCSEGDVKRQKSECLCFFVRETPTGFKTFFQHSNHQRKGVLRKPVIYLCHTKKSTAASKLLPAVSFSRRRLLFWNKNNRASCCT